jgi:hypothetical protein
MAIRHSKIHRVMVKSNHNNSRISLEIDLETAVVEAMDPMRTLTKILNQAMPIAPFFSRIRQRQCHLNYYRDVESAFY